MWRLSYRLYRGVSSLTWWTARTFTPAGLLVLGATVLTAVFGIDTSQSTAYRLFAFLVILLVLGLAGARWRRGQFAFERALPRAVTVGEAFEYRVRVRNLAARAARGLTVRDELADPRPDFALFRAAMTLPRYGVWLQLIERARVARVEPADCPDLPPATATELRVRGVALRRGRVHFSACAVGSTETLGLARTLTRIDGADNLVVLPRRYTLPPLSLPGGRRYQQGGVTLASSVGDSEEFIGLRDYRPGDPLSRVHWKSFARRGAPVVRETQDEYFERYALILDTAAGPDEDVAFEEAVAVAASFACTLDTQDCLLDLMFVGDRAYTFTAGRGLLNAGNLLEALAGVEAAGPQGFGALADAVHGKAGSLSGAVLVLVGWDEPRAALVTNLRARGVELRVLVVAPRPIADAPPGVLVLTPGRVQQGLAQL